jgi:hypothetical protein
MIAMRVMNARSSVQRRTVVIKQPYRNMAIRFLPQCGEIRLVGEMTAVDHGLDGVGRLLAIRGIELTDRRPLEIQVEYTGELLEFAAIPVGSNDDKADIVAPPPSAPTIFNEWVWRYTTTRDGDVGLQNQRYYFNLMDESTLVFDGPSGSTKDLCATRLQARRSDPNPTIPSGTIDDREEFRLWRFSSLLLSPLQHFFPSKSGWKPRWGCLLSPLEHLFPNNGSTGFNFDVAKAKECFIQFASGQLALAPDKDPDTRKRQACTPNSPFHLYFAELADICIKLDIHKKHWQELLPCLVYSSEVFCCHYYTDPPGEGSTQLCLNGIARKRTAPLVCSTTLNDIEADLYAQWQGILTARIIEGTDCTLTPIVADKTTEAKGTAVDE